MSAVANALHKLPSHLQKSGLVRLASNGTETGPSSRSGAFLAERHAGEPTAEPGAQRAQWEQRVLEGNLLEGGVMEIASEGGLALGTSVALRACRRLQQETLTHHGVVPWCAFVDPVGSLYAPGVRAAGVELSKLLVVQPDEESITRVTLKLVESKLYPLVVVDLMGLPSAPLELSLAQWVRVVRRLSLSVTGSSHAVVLLTDQNARRPLPLPVTERLTVRRESTRDLRVTVSKSLHGDLGQARIRWARRSAAQPPATHPSVSRVS